MEVFPIKRLSILILTLIMILSSISVNAAETFTYQIVDNSDYANILSLASRTPDAWMYDEIKNGRMRVLFNRESTNYCFNVFYKFDLTGVNRDSVKKVELLLKVATATTDLSYFELYDVENTTWTGAEINNSSSIDLATSNQKFKDYPVSAESFASKHKIAKNTLGYEDAADANYAIDITDYIINKIDEGKTTVSFCLATSNNYINCAIGKYGKLRVTNTSNIRPTVTSDLADVLPRNTDVTFNVNVSDNDDYVKSVLVSFDGNVLVEETELSVSEYTKAITVPKETATTGIHKLVVKATDNYGASVTYAKNVKVCSADIVLAEFEEDEINETYTFKVKANNITSDALEVIVAICAFDDMYNLIDVNVKGEIVAGGGNVTLNPSLSTTELSGTEIIEAYIWEGNEKFMPIATKRSLQ